MLLRLRVSSLHPSLAICPGPSGEGLPCVLCPLQPQVNGRMQKLGMATPRAFDVTGPGPGFRGARHPVRVSLYSLRFLWLPRS